MTIYHFLAIGIIVLLIVVFFITYLLNKKTTLPKGCEDLKISEESCSKCNNTMCDFKNKIDFEKIEEDIKEDK